MALQYKGDILATLKEHGFSTYALRQDRLLSEGAMQSIRSGKPISWENIHQLCKLLNCQPGDLLEYIPDEE